MSKFALEGFSQSIREELRPRGIRVLNIYPAATDTEIWEPIEGNWPREKMMSSSEIAEAVAFALSRPARCRGRKCFTHQNQRRFVVPSKSVTQQFSVMIAAFGSDVVVNVVASVIASLILLGAGFAWGKYRERKKFGKNLEEYRLLSVQHQPGQHSRIQPQGFPPWHALFPQERRPHRRATIDFHRRTKQCARPARAGRAEGICKALHQVRRRQDRG